MRAEIICVGTEILLGEIVNTNATFLSKECALIGIDIYHQSVIGDNVNRLKETLTESLQRSDCLILTGGLGPTYDDLTKETVASHFGLGLVANPQQVVNLERIFKTMGREMTENNRKQAYLPEGTIALDNRVGTAPGVYLEKEGKIVVLLPGPPYEMEIMFEEQVKPLLLQKTNDILISRKIRVFGMGESEMESRLYDLMTSSTNPTLAPYAKTGECEVRITAKVNDERQANNLINPLVDQVRGILGDVIYGIDVDNLESQLVKTFHEKQLTLAIYDAFSGRSIQRLNDADKTHAILKGAFYENSPTEYSNWKQLTLERAKSISQQFKSDVGIAIIGDDNPESENYGKLMISWVSEDIRETRELTLRRSYSDVLGYMHYLSASHCFNYLIKQFTCN